MGKVSCKSSTDVEQGVKDVVIRRLEDPIRLHCIVSLSSFLWMFTIGTPELKNEHHNQNVNVLIKQLYIRVKQTNIHNQKCKCTNKIIITFSKFSVTFVFLNFLLLFLFSVVVSVTFFQKMK